MQLLLSLASEALPGDQALLRSWRQLHGAASQGQLREVLLQLVGTHLAWCVSLFTAESQALQVKVLGPKLDIPCNYPAMSMTEWCASPMA